MYKAANNCDTAHRKLLVIISFLLMTACSKPAPDYQTLNNGNGDWAELKGNWVLINYWAEWCKPCLKEIPEFNKLAENKEALVFAYNFDGLQDSALQKAVSKFNISYPSLLAEPSADFGLELPKALPSTIVIRPNGEVKTVLLGEQSLDDLKAAIAEQ